MEIAKAHPSFEILLEMFSGELAKIAKHRAGYYKRMKELAPTSGEEMFYSITSFAKRFRSAPFTELEAPEKQELSNLLAQFAAYYVNPNSLITHMTHDNASLRTVGFSTRTQF